MPDPDPQTPPPLANGWKTSEFWQTLAVTGAGVYMMIRGANVEPVNETLIAIGGAISGVTSLGFAGLRTYLKR